MLRVKVKVDQGGGDLDKVIRTIPEANKNIAIVKEYL
jgi:hypothetical protein